MTPKSKAAGLGALLIASASLVSFVSGWEGDEKVAYADKLARDLPTVCNGHTGPDVKVGDVWTQEQCDAVLQKDLKRHGEGVLSCITEPLSQNEYEAYASWTYNVGVGNACGSTLVKLLNAGQHAAACEQLLRWNRANGVVVRGLTNRRKAEREKCLTPDAPVKKAVA